MTDDPGRPPRHARIPSGTLFAGRYRVEAAIGEGSQSVVYRARDEAGGPGAPDARRVALKVIHRHLSGDPKIAQRFQREAQILRRLEGEHVARLLDVLEDDGLVAIALELVEGSSLEAMLAERAPLDLDVAIEITLQVCAALGAAHANGIVHRDLKTANVLVERPAARPGPAGGAASAPPSAAALRVKVVDFGLSKVLQGPSAAGLTEQGMIFGTPEYMAPEQARGDDVDARADLYAAGIMLYEMVVGAPPFSGRSPIGTMSAHLSEPPLSPRAARPGSAISAGLEAVMLRALAKSPADRYASARELAEALAAVRNQPLVITPPGVSTPALDAVGDTDLHLPPPSIAQLGQARTLRADELAAAQARLEGAAVRVQAPPAVDREAPSTLPSPAAVQEEGSARKGGDRLAILEGSTDRREVESFLSGGMGGLPPIVDEETAVSGPPRRHTRVLWAIVAIVAAAVGVVIGVLVGTR